MSYRISTEVISVNINIENEINFCADIENHLLIQLKETYESKCFKGFFINKILKLVARSDCYVSFQNEATIDVSFEVETIKYNDWGYISDVSIVQSTPLPIGDSKYATVTLKGPNEHLEQLTKGQNIPVRIVTVDYKPFEKIGIVGVIAFSMPLSTYIFENIDTVSNNTLTIIDQITDELKLREGLDQDILNFYELLFATSKNIEEPREDNAIVNGQSWRGIVHYNDLVVKNGSGRKNLIDCILKIKDGQHVNIVGLWEKSALISASSPFLNHNPDANVTDEVCVDTNYAINNILKQQLMFLVFIREMTKYGKQPENENIWNLINEMKLRDHKNY